MGESIAVTPILTIPGWMVERTASGTKMRVVNPKEIIKVCETKQERLDENLVRRICYQLDQKCRMEIE